MKEAKFKIGDVVCLNSQKLTSFKLTINDIITEAVQGYPDNQQFNGTYECIYRDDSGTYKRYTFKEETLTRITL